VHRSDDADKKVEPDAIAFLQSRPDGLGADARDPNMSLGVVDELIVDVV
jgi:hypothetical protein